MIEQQLEERFRLAVADEPPLGFDPDDIVDRASRRQRNRRAVAAVVAAVAVVTTATTITFAEGSAPVADKQTYPPTACLAEHEDTDRVGQLVRQALAEHVSGTQFDPENGNAISGLETGEICGVITTNRLHGVPLTPAVDVRLTYMKPPDNADTYAGTSRFEGTRERLADGSELRTYRRSADPGDEYPSQEEAAVVHVRPNGMTVVAATTDLNVASIAELTAVATDPRLTF